VSLLAAIGNQGIHARGIVDHAHSEFIIVGESDLQFEALETVSQPAKERIFLRAGASVDLEVHATAERELGATKGRRYAQKKSPPEAETSCRGTER